MAMAGTAGYVADILGAIKYLRRYLGDHIIYGILPNVMSNGCGDEAVIRTCVEINSWAAVYFRNTDSLLCNSLQLAEKQMWERGGGRTQTDYRCVIRLPSSPGGAETSFSSGPWGDLPCSIRPPRLAEEVEVVNSIVQELREKLAVDLDQTPDVDRWPPVETGQEQASATKRVLVVGSSHAAKIGHALERLGHSVSLVHEPSWRIFRNNAVSLAARVEEVLAGAVFDTIIFAVLDNSTYNALAPNGDIIPARRDNMGKYHIDGELVLSSKSAMFANFNALKPLLEKARSMGGVLMSPLPRYVKTGCCDDAEHMQERNSAEFQDRMKSELR
jgi:hypothetical protein